MEFPSVDTINKSLRAHDLKVLEGQFETKETHISLLESTPDALQKFCEVAKDNSVQTVFLMVSNLEGEELEHFMISPDEITQEEYGSQYRTLLRQVQKHNHDLTRNAAAGPYEIQLFFVLSGLVFSLIYTQQWYLDMPDPEEVIDSFCDEHQEEIQEIRSKKLDKHHQLLSELKNKLENDPEFPTYNRNGRIYCALRTLAKMTSEYIPRDLVEPVAKEAWEAIKNRKWLAGQERVEAFVERLVNDLDFRECKNQVGRKAYVANLLSKETDQALSGKEISEIAELAWAKMPRWR